MEIIDADQIEGTVTERACYPVMSGHRPDQRAARILGRRVRRFRLRLRLLLLLLSLFLFLTAAFLFRETLTLFLFTAEAFFFLAAESLRFQARFFIRDRLVEFSLAGAVIAQFAVRVVNSGGVFIE